MLSEEKQHREHATREITGSRLLLRHDTFNLRAPHFGLERHRRPLRTASAFRFPRLTEGVPVEIRIESHEVIYAISVG
jgi:hypothetical protein